MSEKETINIVFPESTKEEEKNARDLFTHIGKAKSHIFDIEEILNWFKKLEVKEIELYVETSVKSGNVVNLFVSAEGKGGVKVTLVPKKT